MGGDVNFVWSTEVECAGPFQLAKGVKVYRADGPDGKHYIVEATTGGIVGNSLGQVRKDIASAPANMVRQQIKDGADYKNSHENKEVSPAEFWIIMDGINQKK